MKMFKYKMIKYFPYSASEEFINIGFGFGMRMETKYKIILAIHI